MVLFSFPISGFNLASGQPVSGVTPWHPTGEGLGGSGAAGNFSLKRFPTSLFLKQKEDSTLVTWAWACWEGPQEGVPVEGWSREMKIVLRARGLSRAHPMRCLTLCACVCVSVHARGRVAGNSTC